MILAGRVVHPLFKKCCNGGDGLKDKSLRVAELDQSGGPKVFFKESAKLMCNLGAKEVEKSPLTFITLEVVKRRRNPEGRSPSVASERIRQYKAKIARSEKVRVPIATKLKSLASKEVLARMQDRHVGISILHGPFATWPCFVTFDPSLPI